MPGIVTGYLPGHLDLAPSDPVRWARELGGMLARIHAVPCTRSDQGFLLDANAEAAWFLFGGAPPPYVPAHPRGMAVWQATHEHLPHLEKTQPGLVHVDYWLANILWNGREISGVVDWEEAAYGDPAIDVAYCRMNLCIKGQAGAAKELLRAYEGETGREVANQAFWELAAAVRPRFDPQGWGIGESPRRERLGRFIHEAMGRIGR